MLYGGEITQNTLIELRKITEETTASTIVWAINKNVDEKLSQPCTDRSKCRTNDFSTLRSN